MPSRQSQHILKPVVVIPFAAYTTSQTSSTVDLQGWNGLTFYVMLGTWTSGTQAFALWDSPDNTTFTLVDPTLIPDMIDSNGFVTVVDATLNGTLMSATYMGDKRYVQMREVGASTPSSTFGGLAILSFPRNSLP